MSINVRVVEDSLTVEIPDEAAYAVRVDEGTGTLFYYEKTRGFVVEAKESAVASALSASNAETSASNAETSASNAETSASNAALSESNAETSESNAETSESNAASSAVLSQEWAEGSTPGGSGTKSALEWASEASAAASAEVSNHEAAPDPHTQYMTEAETQDVLRPVRDGAAMGRLPGWDMSTSGGSEPATITHSKGTERLRLSITWGSAGATDGMVTGVVYDYSDDSGATWTSLGSDAITYDVDGNVASITWS